MYGSIKNIKRLEGAFRGGFFSKYPVFQNTIEKIAGEKQII